MIDSLSLPTDITLPLAEDYERLRAEGIRWVQQLCGRKWTDHNTHDPGITILELLCYAMTDLGYRTHFDMADLLATEGVQVLQNDDEWRSFWQKQFFMAETILPSNPLTITDWRKFLMLNIPHLKNVWLNTRDAEVYSPRLVYDDPSDKLIFKATATDDEALTISGLWRVLVEFSEDEVLGQDEVLKAELSNAAITVADWQNIEPAERLAIEGFFKKNINELLNAHRNLCEDFDRIEFVQPQGVGLCADFEIAPNITNYEDILCAIKRVLDAYVAPSIALESLSQLLARGKSVEEIYEGVYNERGFMTDEVLEKAERRQKLYVSDVVNELMNIEGIVAIRKIYLTDDVLKSHTDIYAMPSHKTTTHAFRVRPELFRIHFFKEILPVFHFPKMKFDPNTNKKIPDFNIQNCPPQYPKAIVDMNNRLVLPRGKYRDLATYYSIQNEFPQTYKLGQEGIETRAMPLRQAQRLQLKGYLLFAEQILSNYLAQLSATRSLLSLENEGLVTYHFGILPDGEIKDLNQVLPTTEQSTHYKIFVDAYENKDKIDRSNRFLDHLLARFAEEFADYSLLKYTHQAAVAGASTMTSEGELINDKNAFLKHYAQNSLSRTCGRNLLLDEVDVWDSTNISGFERRIYQILGIDSVKKRRLSGVVLTNFENMGFHIVEHLWLRPRKISTALLDACCKGEDGASILTAHHETVGQGSSEPSFCLDPYSMRVTLVTNGELEVAQNMDFRRFVEHKLREEAPAHILLKICWVSDKQMSEFEIVYKDLLDNLKNAPLDTPQYDGFETALATFIPVFEQLNNTYPASYLHDCEDSTVEKPAFVLNRAVLSKLKPHNHS